jgi:hypothetical protein
MQTKLQSSMIQFAKVSVGHMIKSHRADIKKKGHNNVSKR